MPSLKPGGGVEGEREKKNQREANRSAGERRRRREGSMHLCSDVLLLCCGPMGASAHFNDSITANGLSRETAAKAR